MSEFHLPESLEGLTAEGLAGLHDDAVAEFTALNASDDLSNETLERMGVLADAIDAMRARQAEVAEAAARRADLSTRVAAHIIDPPADPEPEPEPEPAAAEVEEVQTEEAEIVAAAARPAPVPSTQVPETVRPMLVITAAADIPQITSGSQLDLNDVARAMHLKARTLSDHSGYIPIASAEKVFESGYDLGDLSRADQFEAIMDNASGNALVASGGWCAPSEILYDFFDIECARGSVIALPTFRANRGGVTWPVSSPLPAVNTTDWVHTEADDIAGYEKPCITIPCPEFDECRLTAYGICVTAGNLMDRAYPENVRRYLNQVFIAHERNQNLRKIAILTAGSTSVHFNDTFGAASALINAILLQAAAYRDKYRMCAGAMLEAVFPLWVRDVIRADIARQDDTLSGEGTMPSDAQITAWFNIAGISPQFINDWQALDQSGPTPIDWPLQVQFLLYAAGTWVEFNGGILDLGVIRDSVLNSTNDYTAAWMEEFFCIGLKGYESRLVTVPICPSGEIGQRTTLDCSVS